VILKVMGFFVLKSFCMFTFMNTTKLHIKNMVCARCIRVVEEELLKAGINVHNVRLGEAEAVLKSEGELEIIRKILKENGFDLADSRRAQIIEKIKNIVVAQIHHNDNVEKINFSELLANELALDYHYISTLFSQQEGMTIEKYIILQRIERVKELLKYDELSLSEIAFKTGYSSVAHLSNQFKKVTGLSATEYKKLRENDRTALDEI
jgi:AraC-like DNA-binding protein